MLRVTIELVSANTGKTTKIGQMLIANTGTGTPTRGNYIARVLRKNSWPKDGEAFWNSGKVDRACRVENYPRKALVVWRLVARSLLGCYPEEKP